MAKENYNKMSSVIISYYKKAIGMISPAIYSATFGFFLFYFFRWVFLERYTADVARNYAIVSAFICGLITFGALI